MSSYGSRSGRPDKPLDLGPPESRGLSLISARCPPRRPRHAWGRRARASGRNPPPPRGPGAGPAGAGPGGAALRAARGAAQELLTLSRATWGRTPGALGARRRRRLLARVRRPPHTPQTALGPAGRPACHPPASGASPKRLCSAAAAGRSGSGPRAGARARWRRARAMVRRRWSRRGALRGTGAGSGGLFPLEGVEAARAVAFSVVCVGRSSVAVVEGLLTAWCGALGWGFSTRRRPLC